MNLPRSFTIPEAWTKTSEEILQLLESSERGLPASVRAERLHTHGTNTLQATHHASAVQIFIEQFTSPLILILLGASGISLFLGETTETIIIVAILFLGGVLGFVQEYRSERALRLLRERLIREATILREGKSIRVKTTELVPGDVVELDVGTIIPADLRLIKTEDLSIDESIITGESLPVAKTTAAIPSAHLQPSGQSNMAFSGTHVVEGSGLGVVIGTGSETEMGRTAVLLTKKTERTNFERGIQQFGNFLLKITLVLTCVVALLMGLIRGHWTESILFALALAVGISPELLPVIITLNLSRGALAMSKKHVLVKRLIGIEDLGNADVLCTDKTGTLTVGSLRVRSAIDAQGNSHGLALAYAMHCVERGQNGEVHNSIDQALVTAHEAHASKPDPLKDAQVKEIISFDFSRRRMSTVVKLPEGSQWMITKGATTEVLNACTTYAKGTASLELTQTHRREIMNLADTYHDQGYRLLAVARRPIAVQAAYTPEDERGMELLGFVLVSDAPKESAGSALKSLAALSVRTVILTGDHERVTQHVADELGFAVTGLYTGEDLDNMNDATLREAVETANVFARITPAQKLRVIEALKYQGHAVAYMGDGVNDAPSLRAADVGISFNTAVDIAKETAGVILLEKNLAVLAEGIREGRRTFVNTRTYLYATISSNFGNMLSVAGAAILLPFIPLLPAQILLLNLLSDIPMLLISTDTVADVELAKPKKWSISTISNFMYFFGTISSLADYATFAILLFIAQAHVDLFRSAWFIESMLTELVVIFLLRSRKICFAHKPSWPLILSSTLVAIGSIVLVMTPLGTSFKLFPVPLWILGAIALIVMAYSLLTEIGKIAYLRFREKSGNGFT